MSRMDKNHLCSGKLEDILWKVDLSVSGKQPNSLKSCSELTSLIIRLRIIRAPSFCNLNMHAGSAGGQKRHQIAFKYECREKIRA